MNETLFSGKAGPYAQYRPRYPAALIDHLYTHTGFASGSHIADTGAGTGIFSLQLLQKGSQVTCIEPNGDMRAEAEQALAPYVAAGRCHILNAPAEHTTLPDACVHFVTAAQAYHWFDNSRYKAECHRILKPGGRVVLAWNVWEDTSPFGRQKREIGLRFYPEKELAGHELDVTTAAAFTPFFAEGSMEQYTFANNFTLNEEALLGLFASFSYTPKGNSPHYPAFTAAVRELFALHSIGGLVTLPQTTHCYIGQV